MKIRGRIDIRLHSGVALSFMFIVIGLMTTPYQAQAQTHPLTEDQDGDGDPLNEDIRADCHVDHEMIRQLELQSSPILTEMTEQVTLSEDDCNFAMQYLSGQCEEQAATGVNVTMVCDDTLAYYLQSRNLLTKDFPTDTERFNTVLNEFEQKTASEEEELQQEKAQEEANTPSRAKGLD